jgi:Flp pilus assembly protein CpaB
MDKKGFIIPFLIALIFATLYHWLLTSKQKSLEKAYQTANVIVAAADIPVRTIISPNLLTVASVPRKFMQADVFEFRSQSDFRTISNMVTKIRIPKGNQIVQSALASLSPEAGLSVKLRPGYRGVIVSVEKEVTALLKPNDRVDILVTFQGTVGGQKEEMAVTILQNVPVLGVGDDLGQGMSGKDLKEKKKARDEVSAFTSKGILSLALNPSDAQYLALAQKHGSISVIVRALGDTQVYPMKVVTFGSIFR